MRSGGCTIQQTLSPEAAAVVKQAVALAKKRGHAQVTPLHVASTLLTPQSGLLRAACLQSLSHPQPHPHPHPHPYRYPFRCRALELCFNVALNRLPTTAATASSFLGPASPLHHHYPAISNALVAAFKRAQAHQRRGSIESQQQPLLAVKIELEQLIISILDDPSVSRVMKEAGFSSTLIKGKVEQAVSIESGHSQAQATSNNIPTKSKDHTNNMVNTTTTTTTTSDPEGEKGRNPRLPDRVSEGDIMSVVDGLVNKRKRSTSMVVVVGECVTTLEGIVKGVEDKLEQGNVPCEALKGAKFVPFNLHSLGNLSREEVEQRIAEIKCHVNNYTDKGVVLYLGDLKWATDKEVRRGYYCPIEHMTMEIRNLALQFGEIGRLWLLGIATFQTYRRCTNNNGSNLDSLEAIWGLHAITIPANSLGLSLIPNSELPSPETSKTVDDNNKRNWLTLEGDKMEGVSRSMPSSARNSVESPTSSLPSWLQHYKAQESVPVKDICKKWSSISNTSSNNTSYEITLSFSSLCPSSSTSYDPKYPNLQHTHQSFEPENFWATRARPRKPEPPAFTMFIQEKKDQKEPTFTSNPNSNPGSTSSSDIMDMEGSVIQRFKEYNVENLKILCNALEKKVPWQRNIVHDIARTVLFCRSGMAIRKGTHVTNNTEFKNKEETWLFFQGIDMDAKEKIAKALAKLVFGSQDKFVAISLSNFSLYRTDSSEDSRNFKRLRDEQNCSYVERFAEAVFFDPHRVFYVEDIEQADYCSQVRIKKAIERGKIVISNGEEVSLGDAIIILSCETFSSRSRACSPSTKHKLINEDTNKVNQKSAEETRITSPSVSLDLNISISDDSVQNDENDDDQSIDEIGLLTSVDLCVTFKIQEL